MQQRRDRGAVLIIGGGGRRRDGVIIITAVGLGARGRRRRRDVLLDHARPQAGRRRAGHEPQPPVASIAPPRVARRLAQDLEPAADLRWHRAEALAFAHDADRLTLEVRPLAQAPAPVDGPRGQPVVGLGLVEVRVAVVLVRDGSRGPV